MRGLLTLGLWLLASGSWAATAPIYLENREPGADFYYTLLNSPGGLKLDRAAVLAQLAQTKPRPQRLSSGDFQAVPLGADQVVLGAFVSTTERFSYREVLEFGFVQPSEVPAGRTLILGKANFAIVNENRFVELTPQDFLIQAPRIVIDGRLDDWDRVPELATYPADYRPPQGAVDQSAGWAEVKDLALPAEAGRVRSIKVETQAGQLFIQIGAWASTSPADGQSYLFYLFDQRVKDRANAATLELPLPAGQGPVYLWLAGQTKPVKVGFAVRTGENLEAVVELVDLPPQLSQRLADLSVDFSQFLRLNGAYQEFYYSTLSLESLKR